MGEISEGTMSVKPTAHVETPWIEVMTEYPPVLSSSSKL
jgi:hypothetical protein